MSTNELAVSPEELQQAADALVQEDTATAVPEDTSIEADIEVPDSNFWDDTGADPQDDSDIAAADAGEDTSKDAEAGQETAGDAPETITYKANGREITLSLEEAKKKLSLADGARKAFNERAKMKRELEAAKKQVDELREFKETWDKLEAVKDYPDKLYELITGKSYQDFIREEVARYQTYQEASPEERQLMDYEERMRALERRMELEKREREAKVKEAEEKLFQSELQDLRSKCSAELAKYKFPDDPTLANTLREVLWDSSMVKLSKLVKEGYDLTPKVISTVFRERAKALANSQREQVTKGVSKAIKRKKVQSKKKAQLASTRSYSDGDVDKLVNLDPLSLWQRLRSRR